MTAADGLIRAPSGCVAGAGGDRLRFAPSVHAVAIDDDMVFLDSGKDAYFCLPDACSLLDLSPGRRWVRVHERSLATEFVAAGLLSTSPDVVARQDWFAPAIPRASAVEAAYERPRGDDFSPAAGALLDLIRAYRGRSFRQLLASAERTSTAPPPSVSPRLLQEVHAFHRWIPYAPVSGKCLLRSFMLLRHLRRRGLDALWVFGVRTWPFLAHCWLQCDDVVLDDHFERVRDFTPILVV